MVRISEAVLKSRYFAPVFAWLSRKLVDRGMRLFFTCRRKVATVSRFQDTSIWLLNTGTSNEVNYDLW